VLGVVSLVAMIVVETRSSAPIIALNLLGNRLYRSANGIIVMSSIAFLGSLFLITLYFQDGRRMSPLASGLSTFPEALGVMLGAQVASRVLYKRLGPRRHITYGLIALAISIGLMASMDGTTSLWWSRLLMFAMGFSIGQVFVAGQAVSFATISPSDTGRASTLYNALRQLGGAIGVAVLTTAVVIVGPLHRTGGNLVANFSAYRIAFVVAGVLCLGGIPWSLAIRDDEAANTIPTHPQKRKIAET
jgi:MFS family permease